MNKKKIFLISNYFHFASEKSSNRYRELGELLSKEPDIELEVITSKFYQRTYEYRTNLEELAASCSFKVTFVDERSYHKSICVNRLLASLDFAKNVLKYIKSQPKPDLIYQVVPTLDVANLVSKYAKKNDIPLIIDIQDLWPEAFKMAISIPVISDIMFAPFLLKANSIYSRADAVCAVSQTYVDRALQVNKHCKSTQAVYIGINLPVFDENVKNNPYPKSDKITLAYCGSLSKSYDIRLVIDALAIMDNPPHFLIMGGGNDLEPLKLYAKEKNVDVTFTGFLPYEEMCGMLCSCDITINPILGSSVASIINKHGDYAACGLPVINTQNSQEYCGLVEDYNMGFNCVGQGAEALAQKIKILCEDENLRKDMGKNARRCAEEKFNRINTYPKLVKLIKEL